MEAGKPCTVVVPVRGRLFGPKAEMVLGLAGNPLKLWMLSAVVYKMGAPLTPPVANSWGETTIGGLSRPFREIASSTPVYPMPNPPRITVLPAHFSGDHANPIWGPKLDQGAFHKLPPWTMCMPVRAVAVVGPSTARLRLFSLE